MLSPTPSELPRLKSVSAPTKPVSHTQQPQSGLGAQWGKISTQQPNPTLFRPASPTRPGKTAFLRRSAPTSIEKQTFPQALRSHFRAKPALSRENRTHFCGEPAFPARNRPHFCGRTRAFSSQSAPPWWRGWEPESDRSRREVILSNRKQLSRTGRTRAFSSQSAPPWWRGWELESDRPREGSHPLK